MEGQRRRREGLDPPDPRAFGRPVLSGHILFCQDTMAFRTARAFVDRLPEERDLRFLLLDLEQVDRESGLDPLRERRPTDPLEDLGIVQHSQRGIPAPTFGRVAGKFVLYRVRRPSELGHVETQGDDEEDNKDGR